MIGPAKKRRSSLLPALGITLAATYCAGFYAATVATKPHIVAAAAKAYADGKASQDWKELAKSNQEYADKLCTPWWFGLTHEDREINLKGKPKRL